MAGAAWKWVLGCGIGCALVVVILAMLGFGGFLFVKDIAGDFEETGDTTDELIRRHGSPSEFRPEPDGSIRPDRLEAFLRARELSMPARREMERLLETLDPAAGDREGRGSAGTMEKIRAGFGLISRIAEFLTRRNQALLEAEIGLGEYDYTYAVAYFSWLGKPVADGPSFPLVDQDEGDPDRGLDEFEVRENRREKMLSVLNRRLLPMLRNQLAGLREEEAASNAWHRRLEEEIEAMEADRYRLPWRDGLPAPLEESLRPYRDRLDESYSPMCNPLEITLRHH